MSKFRPGRNVWSGGLAATVLAAGLTAAGITTVAAPALAAVGHGPDDVFVNEIHYDNEGTDAIEAVEVAGPVGTDLTGWSVVLYNGNGGAPYGTLQLSGTIGDTATVVVAAPGLQNGSPDGLALVDAGGVVHELLSYEGPFTAVGGPANGMASTDIGVVETGDTPNGESLQRVGSGTTSADYTWDGPFTSTFSAVNGCQTFDGTPAGQDCGEEPPVDRRPFDPADTCGQPATPIGQVQGSGASSPSAGQSVTVEGVVTGDFQGEDGDQGDLDGFYVQDAGDGDPATSDALFVYDPTAPQVVPGDRVRVTGTVEEFFELTELSAVTFLARCAQGQPLPPATPIDLPTTGPGALERHEGMLAAFTDPLAAQETRLVDDFGEIRLSAGGPLYNPTEVVEPGAPAVELAAANALTQIILDDARSGTQLRPVAYLTPQQTIRRGDTVSELTGVLTYGFDAWRVQPTEPVVFDRTPRPEGPDDVGGDIQIGSFNVLNYFTTLGDRGAATPQDFEEQEAKIVAAINALGAEVVALQEIENNDTASNTDSALDTLVAALNEAAGEPRWAGVPTPANYTGPGTTDAIATALIYQPAAVQPVGASVAYPDPAFQLGRAPVAQTFDAGGEVFTVISNHFKSKTCGGASGADADQGDGASCFNAMRIGQANALVNFIEQLTTSTGDPDVISLGDLNSYSQEDPIDVLESAGLVGQLDRFVEVEDRWTYVFDGVQGVLDHAFTTPGMSEKVTGADIWHINAGEPDIYEYPADPAFYAANPYRASDHDPALVGLRTTPVSACPQPDPSPTVVMGDEDSGVPNRDTGDGCTVDDLIDDEGEWATHGAFSRHVDEVTRELVQRGVLTARERTAVKLAASRSDIGH